MVRPTLALVFALSLLPLGASAGEQVAAGSLVAGAGPVGPTDAATFLVGDAAPVTGIEGVRLALVQESVGGEPVTLAWTSAVGANLRVHFYDAAFQLLPEDGCARIEALAPREGVQACAAPAGAAHVTVSLSYGAAADYSFRYAYGA